MKNSIQKALSLGVAAGAIALCTTQVKAQGGAMAPAPAMAEAMTPMPVTGTVLRYYVDRSGFVTAMDVQAADGIKMVRFSPSMAQSLTATYPVGSTASVYVTSSMMGGMTQYNLAGIGTTMPAPGAMAMMTPMMVSPVDLLKSEPYTMVGAKQMRVEGDLTGYISDPVSGEVLALILDETNLVRVPRENRQVQASPAPEGITPLIKGLPVVAYGYPESPRYGSVSPFGSRLIATGIAVGGRALGPLGFGKVNSQAEKPLFGFNLQMGGNTTTTPEEMSAMGMGYTTYMAPGAMNSNTMGTTGTATAPGM
jgi:hypothetical protein